jgi:hypothetical protein
LIDAGTDIHQPLNGVTALMAAAHEGTRDRAHVSRSCADPKPADRIKKTGVSRGRRGLDRSREGCWREASTLTRCTPTTDRAMWAAGPATATVEALLVAGARMDPKDDRGKTAIDLACDKPYPETVRCLRRCTALNDATSSKASRHAISNPPGVARSAPGGQPPTSPLWPSPPWPAGAAIAQVPRAADAFVLTPERVSARCWAFTGEAGMASTANRGCMSNAGFRSRRSSFTAGTPPWRGHATAIRRLTTQRSSRIAALPCRPRLGCRRLVSRRGDLGTPQGLTISDLDC